MMMTLIDDSVNDIKYKLYRNIHEIIYPTISKKNVSNYRIIIDNKFCPVLVFYPKKISNISRVVIYVHDNGPMKDTYYNKILKNMAVSLDLLIISIDYDKTIELDRLQEECHTMISYLIEEIRNENILDSNIFLMGDAIGANIIANFKGDYKKVLFSPLTCKNYDYSLGFYKKKMDFSSLLFLDKKYQGTHLVVVGSSDPLYNDSVAYFDLLLKQNGENSFFKVDFGQHDFLKYLDNETYYHIIDKINDFLK